MSITIKDIAKIANVSHTTVSRALNNSPLIKEETKKKIEKIAKEYNYTPNLNAKSLVLDRSYNIGLFFSTLELGTSASFFLQVVRSVNEVIKDKYNLIVKGIDDYKEYKKINKTNFDGIIVLSQSNTDDNFIQYVEDNHIPKVILNRKIKIPNTDCYLSNDIDGAYNAVNYLIKKGHRKIGLIKGKEGFEATEERKKGYMKAMMEKELDILSDLVVGGSYDTLSGYKAMKKILKSKTIPTAVFSSNDDMAIGAIKAINEYGLKVPSDISIIGFDDNGFSEFIAPSLTTVKRPIKEMAIQGTSKLINIIEGNAQRVPSVKYLDTKLIIRESVGQIDNNK